ncbi:porin PorA family protein [Streptomyces sp. NPDC000931]|uniref:porin PorA family protein n=1 Tax=Streptomyces sp. NPDC000931 TaxID=3154372 RepID=UPI00331B73A6
MFEEDDEVAGVAVRRYTQTVDATQVPDSARDVPAALFDPDAEGTVSVNRWLTAERTFWVEPTTGILVNLEESRSETLRPQNGSGEVELLDAELALAEGQVSGYAEQARVRSLLLRGLDLWAPWTLGPVGAVAVLAGLLGAWRARPPDQPGERAREDAGTA